MERTPTEATLERLALCNEVINRVRQDFEVPQTVEEKAEVLVSIDNLIRSVFILHKEASDLIWPEGDPVDR